MRMGSVSKVALFLGTGRCERRVRRRVRDLARKWNRPRHEYRARRGSPIERLQVRVLQERGARAHGRDEQAGAAVSPAAIHDILSEEAPDRANSEVRKGGSAMAQRAFLGRPTGIADHLLEMVR